VGGIINPAAIVNGSSGSDDPRVLARDGLLGLGYTPLEVDELLDGAEGDRPEDLIAYALRTARR
jgi:Holliday junction DNA helicase RuvA